MQVKVRNNNVEAALRVFKKKSAEIIWEVREREYYEKPSISRKTARKAAIKREQKRKK
jgi:small subunit ribosomal protein S21